MKKRQIMRRLMVAMLACVMVATSVNVIPVAAEESGVEVKTESLFSATFDQAYWTPSEVVAAYGFTGTNDCGSGRGEDCTLVTNGTAMYLTSSNRWGQRSVWKSINVPNGEKITIEFDTIAKATNPDFRVGMIDVEPNSSKRVDLDLYKVHNTEWTKVKIEIQYNADGSAVSTAYTKSLSDENAEYVAVEGYTDVAVSKDYAADGVTNIYFFAQPTKSDVAIDNLDIYRTYTVVPDDSIVYEKESLFSATFEQEYWNSEAVVAGYGFTGTNDCGSGNGENFYLVSQKGALYLASDNSYGQRSVWKSINVPKGEMLTIEFEAQPKAGASAPDFAVGLIDETPHAGNILGTNMFRANLAEWLKIKIEVVYNADGSAVSTTYTKSMSDENAEYTAVNTVEVPKDYAADGVTNVYFFAQNSATYVTIDNLDIYRTYTVVPEDSIVYEKKSQFSATFDQIYWTSEEVVTGYGFTGTNDCGCGYGDYTLVSNAGVMYLTSSKSGGQISVWKSVSVPNGEMLTIEFEAKPKADATAPDFAVGMIDETPHQGNILGTNMFRDQSLSQWLKFKIEVVYEADGSAVYTTYTKSMTDVNAEYTAVATGTVPKAYAADDATNIYFFTQKSATHVEIDNLDIYTVHAYKNGKCTVCDDYKDDIAAVGGYNLTLQEGTVGLNFHMDMSAKVADLSKTEVRFTVNGKTQTMSYDEAQTSGDYRVFTCEVDAKQMSDEITAVMYNDGVAGTAYTYSVKEYANKILADSTTYAKEIPLVQAMLNYGTYAQEYFDYNTDNLANGGTYLGNTALSTITVDSLATYTQNTVAGNESVKLTYASLVLESKTALRLYLNVADGVTVEGLKQSKYGSYVEKADILPQDLSKDVTINVSYGDSQNATITYNCMAYCYNVLKNSTNDALKNVVSALCLYSQSATAYAEQ